MTISKQKDHNHTAVSSHDSKKERKDVFHLHDGDLEAASQVKSSQVGPVSVMGWGLSFQRGVWEREGAARWSWDLV